MLEYDVFALVDYVLDLPYGQVKFLCQSFIANAVNIPPFQNVSVPGRMNILINDRYDAAV